MSRLRSRTVMLSILRRGEGPQIRFYSRLGISANHPFARSLCRPNHAAARTGSSSYIRTLHESGADMLTKSADGSTALYIAVRNRTVRTVSTLLRRTNGLLNTICDGTYFTPCMDTSQLGFQENIGVLSNRSNWSESGGPRDREMVKWRLNGNR